MNNHLAKRVDKKNEIDPTQKAAKVEGRSPAAILASTFSDELAISSGGKSNIFAVSVKDRGAVFLQVQRRIRYQHLLLQAISRLGESVERTQIRPGLRRQVVAADATNFEISVRRCR